MGVSTPVSDLTINSSLSSSVLYSDEDEVVDEEVVLLSDPDVKVCGLMLSSCKRLHALFGGGGGRLCCWIGVR